ncbi:hypothetical protein [Aquisediminimonas profunda]|uniref:hypothetical protein n=1 Tax=Aquisediminimonas profunda TaxID=1550733 RepID=UPI001C636741|nr:hypothetical protein [Aquisediminimonas profunda]
MYEPLYEFLPIGALAIFLVTAVMAANGRQAAKPAGWRIPAAFSVLFLGWSLFALAQGGLGGVWVEHTRNAWGNQIWFDLLLALGIGWSLLLPRTRAVGMRPWPWLALLLATGSVGLLAMLARCFFLEERVAQQSRRQ